MAHAPRNFSLRVNLPQTTWVQWALKSFENRNEPCHEKTRLMQYVNDKATDQPAHLCSLISAFVVRCLDSIIHILAKSKHFKTLASLCSWAGRFESYMYLVANPENRFSCDVAQIITRGLLVLYRSPECWGYDKFSIVQEKKFKHCPRAGADNPFLMSAKILMSAGRPHHYSHLLQV